MIFYNNKIKHQFNHSVILAIIISLIITLVVFVLSSIIVSFAKKITDSVQEIVKSPVKVGEILKIDGLVGEIKGRGQSTIRLESLKPKKIGKGKAIDAITKALKKIPADKLLPIVKAYAKATRGDDQQYMPNPATWFNQERWNDDPKNWEQENVSNTSNEDAQKLGILEDYGIA